MPRPKHPNDRKDGRARHVTEQVGYYVCSRHGCDWCMSTRRRHLRAAAPLLEIKRFLDG